MEEARAASENKIQSIAASDFRPGQEQFRKEVLSGLQKSQKKLSPKYFYDDEGSRLFELICKLEEYYIPRTEAVIMETYIKEMAEMMGRFTFLIEYGSGDCTKVRILLDNLQDPIAYVPIDISGEQLLRATDQLNSCCPHVEVLPVCADYTTDFELPVPKRLYEHKVVYFPGSTIGNFDPIQALHFLEHIAVVCGPGGALLIGVDLKKDPQVLHRAYNDKHGVTAAFNLNLLQRINQELNCDFALDSFEHKAFYNPRDGCMEMHLISLKNQTVHLDGMGIPFTRGESIWTESSYKYSVDEFKQLAAKAGFSVEQVWTDDKEWFSVQYLVNKEGLS